MARLIWYWKRLSLVCIAVLLLKIVFMLWKIVEFRCHSREGPIFIGKDGQRSEELFYRQEPHSSKQVYEQDESSWGPHKLAVLVPFRNCFEELQQFVPHIHQYLNRKKIRHEIYVINQVDIYRFNKASLVNVGFLESASECDYMAIHDIDLLPMNDELSYEFPHTGVFHVSASGLHPDYNYTTFIGGILLLQNRHFGLVNGMSNKYWGWGREDDDLYVRLEKANFVIERPQGITTGLKTFKNIHDAGRRPRDKARYRNQATDSFIPENVTGINTLQYDVISRANMMINTSPFKVINVKLKCDLRLTPWCVTPELYKNLTAT